METDNKENKQPSGKPSGKPSDASACSAWWCEECQQEVEPEMVTYEETHDARYGGCGQPVIVKQNADCPPTR